MTNEFMLEIVKRGHVFISAASLEEAEEKFNKDYTFCSNKEKEPMIQVKRTHLRKIRSMYKDSAWSQLSPYICFL